MTTRNIKLIKCYLTNNLISLTYNSDRVTCVSFSLVNFSRHIFADSIFGWLLYELHTTNYNKRESKYFKVDLEYFLISPQFTFFS